MSSPSQPDLEPDALLDAAREKSVASRSSLARTIGDLFIEETRTLSDRERALMSDILCRLIGDVETAVRQHLATRLATKPNAPPELIRLLANDEIAIARPILLESTVLADSDLIDIIKHRTSEHQLAIAMRRSVSEAVSGCLVEYGTPQVITALLENDSAEISQLTLEYLVEQSRRVDSYQGPLLRREELPLDLARRMHAWVGIALRQHIEQSFDIDPKELATDVAAATYGAVTELKPEDDSATSRLAGKLATPEEVDPKLLIDMLKQGEIALFEAMFAKGCGLEAQAVHTLVSAPDGAGLCIACRAAGLSFDVFDELFRLTARARSSVVPAHHSLAALATTVDARSAHAILANWRPQRDYAKLLQIITDTTGHQVATGDDPAS